jgi:hypothetical protein
LRKNNRETEKGLGYSVINGLSMAESSLMNESQLIENLPKEIFRQKMRKKLSLLALLKDSYREKELIEKYKDD